MITDNIDLLWISYLNKQFQFSVKPLIYFYFFVCRLFGVSLLEFLVDHIIKLSKALNMRVLAEGVETTEQLDVLRKIKCDEIQGFYYMIHKNFHSRLTYVIDQTLIYLENTKWQSSYAFH